MSMMKILSNSREGVIVELDPCFDGRLCVAKILTGGRLKRKLHSKLRLLDPEGKRFAEYRVMFIENVLSTAQQKEIEGVSGRSLQPTVLLSPSYEKIDPKSLTKRQYRHLRESVELLASNNIAHGDLPENVMLNVCTRLPVIIDFGEGILNADKIALEIDRIAFLTFFRVARPSACPISCANV
jgi:hypothetical protein